MAVFAVEVPVRWTDLDAQGHVNNGAVVDYLQEARVSVLLNGPNAALLGGGIVIVAHSLAYLRPIVYDTEPLCVEVRLGDIGAARLTYAYELRQRGHVVARARSVACVIDVDSGRPRRLTPQERDGFAQVAEPLEAWQDLDAYAIGPAAHEHPFVVRWSDLDAYGHVNNTNFFTYTGEARVALHHLIDPAALPTDMASRDGGMLLIAAQDLRYTSQLQHRLAPYLGRTAIGRVGRTSVVFAHDIVDPTNGRVFARGTAVLVHADADGRPIPVPDVVRAAGDRWPATLSSRR